MSPFEIPLTEALEGPRRLEAAVKRLARIEELAIAMMLGRWQEDWGRPSILRNRPSYGPRSYSETLTLWSDVVGLISADDENLIPRVTVDDVADQVALVVRLTGYPN